MSVNLKNRLKSYSFWVSLASALLLLVQAIGKPLGLVINEEIYMSIINSVLGIFVVLGIVSHPAQNLIGTPTPSEWGTLKEETDIKPTETPSKEASIDSQNLVDSAEIGELSLRGPLTEAEIEEIKNTYIIPGLKP